MSDSKTVTERLRQIASEMRGIGASTMTPHELLSYFAGEIEKVADLADTLGSGKGED